MVAPGTFVTAAHCLADDEPTPVLSEQFAVIGFAGSYDTKNPSFPNPCNPDSLEAFIKQSAPNAIVRAIDKFQKPIHYNKVPGYDIMLVFLSGTSCAADKTVMPTVKIYGQCGDVADWVPDAEKITLLGFGATIGEEGKPSDKLKKLDMPIQSIGASDEICNLDVAQDETFPSIVCSKETPASTECADADGIPTPDAPGCVPGMKGASGDSGGPWVTEISVDTKTQIIKAFTQSSGQVNDKGDSYGYLIRDAWFQDFILYGINTFDSCGGASMVADDIFVGYHASSEAQYCEGVDCAACMDNVVTKHDCLEDYRESPKEPPQDGGGDDDDYEIDDDDASARAPKKNSKCAIAPVVVGCKTIPTASALPGPSCSETFLSGSVRHVFAKVGLMLISAQLFF